MANGEIVIHGANVSFDLISSARPVTQPIRRINRDLFPTQVDANRMTNPDRAAVTVPHAGHVPMLEESDRFNDELEEILDELMRKR
jgi:pimeloyl-ACP methyl ester carboxylesterase